MRLGIAHPSRLGLPARCWRGKLTERELQDWFEYYQSDPWGEDRADMRSGIIAALIANKDSKRRYRPKDFLLYPPPLDEETQKKYLAARARGWAAATKAKFKGK